TSTDRRPRIRSSRARPESGLLRTRLHVRLIFRRYVSAVLTEASAAKYCQMSNKSCSASGDQTTVRLPLGMPLAGSLDDFLYVELPPGPSVERADAFREVGPQAAELRDVSEQLAPDPLLRVLGESLDLGNGKLQAVHCAFRLIDRTPIFPRRLQTRRDRLAQSRARCPQSARSSVGIASPSLKSGTKPAPPCLGDPRAMHVRPRSPVPRALS